MALQGALSRLRISEPGVKTISREFNLERGLVRSFYKPELKISLDPMDLIETVKKEWPVDGVDVVEWMQISTVEMAVLQARLLEYNRLGSEVVGSATDPRYPGLVVEDCKIKDDWGSDVKRRGYGIGMTPRGNFNIPYPGKADGVFRDVITVGLASYASAAGCQWTASLLKWKSLAETPIRQTVGFYRDSRGNVAPNFFLQIPARPALSVTVTQRFSSDKDQTLNISFRDPTDYSKTVGSKSVDIASGESEVTYTVSAFPYCPPLICEIGPKDNTQIKLESYTVA
jgi:hypothetical protein